MKPQMQPCVFIRTTALWNYDLVSLHNTASFINDNSHNIFLIHLLKEHLSPLASQARPNKTKHGSLSVSHTGNTESNLCWGWLGLACETIWLSVFCRGDSGLTYKSWIHISLQNFAVLLRILLLFPYELNFPFGPL